MLQRNANREQQGEDPESWKRNLPRLLAKVAAAKTIFLYEGLPHPMWESGELAQEKQKKKTRRIHGYDFYVEPIPLKASDAPRLKALCETSTTYDRYGGQKACGGYHPDWCVVLDQVEILLCFGCNEARLYSPDEDVYADFYMPQPTKSFKQLKQILKSYRQNRPLTSHYKSR